MSVEQNVPVGRDVQTEVLPEYTDAHLTSGAHRGDYYGLTCRLLLQLPAERRQAAWAQAYRATHHTPTEWRQTEHGPMAVSGMTQVTGDFNAELRAVVNGLLAEAAR